MRKTLMNNDNNNNALHPKDYIDRLYVSRKEGGRGRANFEDSVNTSIRLLEHHLKKNKEATRNKTNNTTINKITITKKQK